MFVGWSHVNRHFGHLRLGPVHVFFPVLVEDVVADGCVDSESPVLVSMATVSMAEVSEAPCKTFFLKLINTLTF